MANDNIQSGLAEMLTATPCLPVVVIDDAADALPMIKALQAGGIFNVEVTLRTPAAIAAITAISHHTPRMDVGAGTVFTAEQVKQAKDAGATYIVSPGYSAIVHAACADCKIPYLPGAVTSTEIQAAREKGFRILKFFAAEASGGVKMIKAIAPVFQDIKFCATGGITADNAKEYLSQPNVIAVGMSAIVPPLSFKTKDWAAVTAMAAQVKSFR
jgi:2-dehydro-3-deoxyphosphogluconate aldolase / (4S)-4-hydroxy-2-oxoglutarate aldolase